MVDFFTATSKLMSSGRAAASSATAAAATTSAPAAATAAAQPWLITRFWNYFFKGGATQAVGGVSETGRGLLNTGIGTGKMVAGTGIATTTVVGGSILLDEVRDTALGEDGNSGMPQPIRQMVQMGSDAYKEYTEQKKKEETPYSPEGALLFGGLLGGLGLLGAWLGGATVGMIALIGGGLAVAGAMGGAVLGGDAAKQAKAALETPAQDKQNTTGQEHSQEQASSTYSALGGLSAPTTGPMPPREPNTKTLPATGVGVS